MAYNEVRKKIANWLLLLSKLEGMIVVVKDGSAILVWYPESNLHILHMHYHGFYTKKKRIMISMPWIISKEYNGRILNMKSSLKIAVYSLRFKMNQKSFIITP